MARRRTGSATRPPAGDDPDPRLRELFAVPPAGFTAARDALSRALAAEGSPEAPRVKRLRRPTAAAWLMNALARERAGEVEALLAVGDRLRQAQVRALRGDAAELRAATGELHAVVATLVQAARDVAAARLARLMGAALLAEVESGLRAIATGDATARRALRAGVLEEVPRPGGIELLGGLVPVPRPDSGTAVEPAETGAERRPRAGKRTGPDARRGARKDDRARRAAERRARADAARRERERRRASAEAARADRATHEAEARLRAAERVVEEARRRLEAARSASAAARAAAAATER